LNDRVAELTQQLDVLASTRQALESLTRGMTQLDGPGSPDVVVDESGISPPHGLGVA
jgi:hypothetical protein